MTEESIKDGRMDPSNCPETVKEDFDLWRWRTWEEEGISNTTKYISQNKYIVGSLDHGQLGFIYKFYNFLKRGIYTDKSLKQCFFTYKSLIYNQIQFISPALPCYIIKPSPDFQFVNIQQGCNLNKGCWITKENVSIMK